jgi:hypothetical protein
MFCLKKAITFAAAICLGGGGLVVAGAPAARAETGPPQPYQEPGEGISVPVFGLIAIAGIATIAIWQGVNDAKKKKEAQQEKKQEIEEQEEFEEYFDFGPEEPDAAGAATPGDTAAAVDTDAGAASGE